MTNTKNVLISGASVAGPAAAYWFRRFGYNPTVVERAPELRDSGNAVDFRGPAHLTVLRRMGLLDEIRERQTVPKKWIFVDGRGRQKASLPPDFAGGEVEIRRGDLSRVLYEATRDTTEYIFGDHITSLTETAGGMDVTFNNGVARTFDLVIGADGMHSGVRVLAFGDEDRFSRFMGAYFASFDPGRLEREGELRVYNEPGRFVSAGLLVFRAGRLDYDRQDVTQQKRLVADAYAGAGWDTGEIIQAMREAPDFYMDSISQIRMEKFTHGRVALLGDAGHGATIGGMGTGLGIVGSYVLAGELAAAGGDYRVAFPRYQELMKPYAWGAMGDAGKFLAPKGKRAIMLRNQMVRLMSRRPVIKLIGRIDMKVASNIALKNYET